MSRSDLKIIGINAGNRPYRVAASATRYYYGEPASTAGTYSSGACTTNTVVVTTDTKPIIGTDSFAGIFAMSAPATPATLAAHTSLVTVPLPNSSLIRGFAKTRANVDTDAELLLILWDYVTIDLTAAVYTIDDVAAANTSGFRIENGNVAKQTLDVSVDARAMRISIS